MVRHRAWLLGVFTMEHRPVRVSKPRGVEASRTVGKSELLLPRRVDCSPYCYAGISSPINTAMMAITTSSSISV
jgi:hypothetical protein